MPAGTEFNFVAVGEERNPAALFLHGFMGCAADWEKVTRRLSNSLYCVCVDLPGHGSTRLTNEEDYRMEPTARHLAEWIGSTFGGRDFGLVGYSMGGRLAYYLAVHFGSLFGRIVIESATPGLTSVMEREARVRDDSALAQKLLRVPYDQFVSEWYSMPLFETINKRSETYQEMVERRMLNSPEELARSLRMMGTGAQPSLWERLGDITSRVLLISGGNDRKFTVIAREAARVCPHCEIAVVANAGHNVHLEQPGAYSKLVEDFLLADRERM